MIAHKHPMELARGDVIAEHPRDHSHGRWPVAGPAVRHGEIAEIPVFAETGQIWLTAGLGDDLALVISPRQNVIAGLRALADFLEAHPFVPVAKFQVIAYDANFGRTESQAACEVDRVAAILGVRPGRPAPASPVYAAIREFGPVRYQAQARPGTA